MLRNGNRHFVPRKSAKLDKPAHLACYTGLDTAMALAIAEVNDGCLLLREEVVVATKTGEQQ